MKQTARTQLIVAPLLLLLTGCATKPITNSVGPRQLSAEQQCHAEEYLQRDLSSDAAFNQKSIVYVTKDGKTCRY